MFSANSVWLLICILEEVNYPYTAVLIEPRNLFTRNVNCSTTITKRKLVSSFHTISSALSMQPSFLLRYSCGFLLKSHTVDHCSVYMSLMSLGTICNYHPQRNVTQHILYVHMLLNIYCSYMYLSNQVHQNKPSNLNMYNR